MTTLCNPRRTRHLRSTVIRDGLDQVIVDLPTVILNRLIFDRFSSTGFCRYTVGNHTSMQECNESVDWVDASPRGATPAPNGKSEEIHRGEKQENVQEKQGGMTKIPVEIFTDIAHFLSPGDLIALARLDRFFRNILLHSSSIKIWRQAESNVPGLPRCPFDMCEPQYAALLFSKHCTLCGACTAARPNMYIRARLCTLCRKTE
ncbi:hypothetical protein FRC08_008208 [Ceratobasidium sp. 394]|nr:hypothetical protein FRC08_008208 [Ceratobasidium sp. 394]